MPNEHDRPTSDVPDPLNPMGAPPREPGAQTWQPKRGPVFKALVWALLGVIALLILVGLVTGFVL